jgi:hypothetical protein
MKHAPVFLALFAAALLFASPAAAQTIRATELWYGLYTVEDVQVVEDRAAPGGQRRVGGTIKQPAQNASRVPHVPGSYFGLGYRLSGSNPGETITVRHVQLIPPPGLRDNQGQFHDRLDRTLNLSSGRDLFIGLSMGNATPLGTWTMQVWHEGRVLIERKFELYKQ